MIKPLTFFLLILTFANCNQKSVQETERKKAFTLSKKADENLINNDTTKAIKLYQKALKIDNKNLHYIFKLAGIYSVQKNFDKAIELIETIPESEKNTAFYYQFKGNIYDFKGEFGKAKYNYKKAFEKMDLKELKNEYDLNQLVNYTMLETLSGLKESAVERLNQAMNLKWLTDKNIEYLTIFRNEFEFYQEDGISSFNPKKEIKICTDNVEDLKKTLKLNHVNISSCNFSEPNLNGTIFISKKFGKKIEKLNIKPCN